MGERYGIVSNLHSKGVDLIDKEHTRKNGIPNTVIVVLIFITVTGRNGYTAIFSSFWGIFQIFLGFVCLFVCFLNLK